MAAEVFLRRLSRWQAEQQRNDIGDVHVMVYRGDVGTEYRDREDFLGRFEQDVRRPDFDMVVAGRRGSSAAPMASTPPAPGGGGRGSTENSRRTSRSSPPPGGCSCWRS